MYVFNDDIHKSTGHAVAKLVEATRYTIRKVAVSIPNSVIGIFHCQSFRTHYGPGIDSASNRNDHQEYFLGEGKGDWCIGLIILPFMCRLS
jgi:hypothetical protein